jgi:tetratricopeptide (TPR) repeat protein
MDMTSEKFCEAGKDYYNSARDKSDYENAIRAFTMAIEKDPYCIEAYDGLSLCYGKLGNNEKAMEFAVKAREIQKAGNSSISQIRFMD